MILRSLLRADAGGGRAPWDDFWYRPVGMTSATGLAVNAQTALENSAVWACVRLVSETVASLPLILYQRQPDGGKQRATQNPVFDILKTAPNDIQTPFSFKRVLMTHALLWGNAYAQILPGPRGSVDHLLPLHPDGVRPVAVPGGVVYMVRQPDGTERPTDRSEILHLPGLSLDGVSGLSVMRYAREAIATGLAAGQYTARFFGNGARPGGLLKHPGKLSKDAKERLRAEWQAVHGGVANLHKVAVLEEGVEWAQTGITNEDAQLLGVLEWSTQEAARRFNVPLWMIQANEKNTAWGTGMQTALDVFKDMTLRPWLVLIQETVDKQLVFDPRCFSEFIAEALLQLQTLERFQAYQIAAGGNAPWMTRNEIRRRENLNPLPGLDEPLAPLNMAPAGQTAPSPAAPNGTAAHGDILDILALPTEPPNGRSH